MSASIILPPWPVERGGGESWLFWPRTQALPTPHPHVHALQPHSSGGGEALPVVPWSGLQTQAVREGRRQAACRQDALGDPWN